MCKARQGDSPEDSKMETQLLWIYLAGTITWVAWFLYLTRKSRDYEESVYGRFHRAYRRMIFWLGDIRFIHHFPWITWDVHNHLVEYEEAIKILGKCRRGDVGIHRDNGYLSNLGIPGFTKHAWIHVNNPLVVKHSKKKAIDVSNMMIVEAVSEGVIKRHGLFPIRSDYTIILRPRNVSGEDLVRAIKKAENIVGCRYDASFKFDIEEELDLFSRDINKTNISGEHIQEDKKEFDIAQNNMRAEWDGGFSCTETISFAWWHMRRILGLFRQRSRGKDVILADQLLNRGWDIVAMSNSVTPEIAEKMGLGEEGLEMIKAYRRVNPV